METDFGNRLLGGERILWQGVPQSGILFTPRDALLIPFSFMWFGFAIFWEWSVITQANAPDFFTLWGIPFVLIGLYMAVGRFFADAWLRGRTSYAVTTQRILILRSPPFGSFTAMAVDRLPELSLIERSDGRGTIRFQPNTPVFGRGNGFGSWMPSLDATQFLMIREARNVFDIIQKAGAKAA